MYVVFVRFISEYLIYILFCLSLVFIWKRDWKQVLTIAVSLALAIIIRKIAGIIIYEPRPFVVDPKLLLYPTLKSNESSFFSGHSTNAFAFAGAIFWNHRKAGAFLLIGASLVAIGRVLAGLHYIWDVGLGILVGLVVSYVALRLTTSTYFDRLLKLWQSYQN